MLTRVRIRGYKSLRDVDLPLSQMTVVFGANTAGKSNLFDALSLLSRMVTEQNLDAAFKSHRGAPLEAFTFGEHGIEDVLASRSARFSIEVDVRLDDDVVASVEQQIRRAREGLPDAEASGRRPSVTEKWLRYALTVEVMTASGHLRIMDESLRALRADGEPRQSRSPFLEKQGNRIHLRMEKQAHPTYEDIGQDRTIVSKSLYPPHYPHITAFREELSRWRFYYIEPTAMRDETPVREVESLDPRGHDIAPFFNSLKAHNPKQFQAIAKALRQVIPTIDDLDVERTTEGFVRLIVREQGMRVSARLISEGTLRVLGLLAIANPIEPVSLVGYEEPENGVHPRRLSLVANLLSGISERGHTQLLINTHSPVLPEFFLDKPALLLRCYRDARDTRFEAFEETGLFAPRAIENALDDETPFRERVVRGDFGG
ncbi:MAG TPA: AAA family ATPase [Capillimicrobium sp.]|nr:AAA family ATPase [Capillimicrobium sp.]